MRRTSLSSGIIVAATLATGPTLCAAPITNAGFYSGTELNTIRVAGSTVVTTRQRFGNNATNGAWEIGVGTAPGTAGQFNEAQARVNTGESFTFRAEWNGTVFTYWTITAGGTYSASWPLTSVGDSNDLFLLAQTTTGNSVSITDLFINSEPVVQNWSTTVASGSQSNFILVPDVITASNTFTLVGTATWNVTSGTGNERPKMEVMLGRSSLPGTIPEPTSLAMLAPAALLLRRRR
jgi:hypothetical protein